MKHIIKFNIPEESEELDCAINGAKYKTQLEAMWQELFRPRHKHGYKYEKLNALLGLNEELETSESIACNQLMDQLEQIYREIIRD